MWIFRATIEPCVLIQSIGNTLSGLVILQVYDSIEIGTNNLLDAEEAASKKYRSKPRRFLSPTATTFTRSDITRHANGQIVMIQLAKIKLHVTPED